MLCTCTFLVSLVSQSLLIGVSLCHMLSNGVSGHFVMPPCWCFIVSFDISSHGVSWCWASSYVNIVRYRLPVNLSRSLIPRRKELGNEAASVCTRGEPQIRCQLAYMSI